MEEARLRWKGRLIARLTAIAFDGVEERRFFAADVGSGSSAEFHIKVNRRAEDTLTEKSMGARRLYRVRQTLGSEGYSPRIWMNPLLGADGHRSNGHAL